MSPFQGSDLLPAISQGLRPGAAHLPALRASPSTLSRPQTTLPQTNRWGGLKPFRDAGIPRPPQTGSE